THSSEIGLSDLKIQYKDYAAWQLSLLESEKYQKHRDFWLDRLGGRLSLLNLPAYKQRPRIKTYNGESLSLLLPSSVANQLKGYVDANGGSQFMLVVALLNVLLYRYTRTTDVIIGSPVAGREHADLEDQIGFYVNTLVLRNEVDPNESLNQFYERVKTNTFSAFEHQMYPFDRLVEELDLMRDTSRSVVFDISLTYHNIYQEEISAEYGERAAGEVRSTGSKKVKNDIELHVQELGDYVSMDLFYNKDVYDQKTMSDFMRHFQQITESFLKEPQLSVNQVDFLRSDEREEQLHFNTETIPYPDSDSLVRLFEKQVIDNPDNIAIVYENESWTYTQLDDISTQLANCLKNEYQISQGDMVGVQVEKSDWAIIAFIAVLKSGGVYVPIDPNYPSDRKQYICDDSVFRLLITQTSFIYDIDYYDGEVFAIDVEFTPEEHSKELDIPFPSGEDLAYVIYTSGSTGKPKGVLIPHKEISNSTLAQIACYETSNTTNGLLFASLSFDTSLSEILMVLMAGGTLSIIGDHSRKDPQKLTEFIQKNKVTLATIPPSYVTQMDIDEISGLKKLITAGEPPNLKKALSFLKYGTYYNAYGPTEASICATVYKLENEEQVKSGGIPIGKPLQNVELFILNEAGLTQPLGVAGEICIGGTALAQGYLNNAELTEKKFVENALSSAGRIYRTGDLGRWLSNGNIEFLGRVDDQFKINGYRVEPGEIEHVLLENRDVKAAAIVPQVSDERITSMIAYLVPETKEGLGEEESLVEINLNKIRSFLENRLPIFMIPSEFILLDNLALTPNGKIDKKALSKHTGKSLSSGIEFVPPQTENEKVLVEVLEDVLQRDKIGINDSFYNLGGDSVKSIQTVGRLKQQGYVLSVEHILKTPEVKTLAGFMTKAAYELDQSEVSGDIVLAPIQNWFFQHNGIKRHHHFNQSVVLKSEKSIDTKKLETCLVQLTTHHDLLRLTASHEDGKWNLFSQTSESKAYSLHVHDLKEDENSDQTIQSIGEELQASFELEKGPLFKVVHFQLKEYDLLGIVAHHLIVDGVSWRILLEDLQTLYTDVIQGLAPKLPKKTSSFQSWTAALKEYTATTKIEKERAYWERIGQTSVDPLPVKSSTEEQAEHSTISFYLGEAHSEQLQTNVHHVYKTQINDLLLTALGLSLKETFGLQKTLVQIEGHGREDLFDRMDLSRTVGWFTSMYPLLLDISGSEELTDTLVQVKDELRRIPNKGIGHGVLSYLAEEGLRSDVNPQITFNFLGDFGSNPGGEQDSLFEYTNQNLGSEIAEENKISALLDVSGIIVEGNLNISVTYPNSAFENEAMEQLLKIFERNLVSLIEELSSESKTYLTASDLTFKGLTAKEWKSLNADTNIEDIYELSPLQNGIFFHWLAQESNSIYFEQTNYRIHAPQLDTDKLKNAYQGLVDRHAVLRTSFSNEISDRPLQIVHKEVPVHFSHEKLDENANPEEYLVSVKERDMDKGFDLSSPSQMRLHIIELSDDRYEFIWSHHHILMDGWCISVLINDFNALLGQERGEDVVLPEVTKYSNYIEWLDGIDRDDSLSHWKEYLSGYDQAITFPFEKDSPLRDRVQAQENLELTGTLFKDIEQLCSELEITTSTFVQCAWGLLLAQYNNTTDVVFGKVVSGRPGELEGVEDIIGLFINTVPVRVNYEETDTPQDVLRKLQSEAIEGSNHHYINLSEVQAQSELGMNLINHIMIYQNYAVKNDEEQGDESNDDLQVESMEVFEQSNYDLNMVVGVASDSLNINVRYDSNRYHKGGVERLIGHLKLLVSGLVNQRDLPISQINCISKEEKNHLLFELNDTKTELPDETILDMIKVQVGNTSSEVAVSFENEVVSYADLDSTSNQFADYLIQKYTVEKGDFVELKLPRNGWTLVTILGIWKAGGVYVPVDPEYPDFRINYIEEDANCKVMVDANELNAFKASIDDYSDQPIQREINQNDLAYVIYTSG
ncbi:MAG: amino acid adenylation domain-containing protein, partial [Crocinitomicaceae bacterium]